MKVGDLVERINEPYEDLEVGDRGRVSHFGGMEESTVFLVGHTGGYTRANFKVVTNEWRGTCPNSK